MLTMPTSWMGYWEGGNVHRPWPLEALKKEGVVLASPPQQVQHHKIWPRDSRDAGDCSSLPTHMLHKPEYMTVQSGWFNSPQTTGGNIMMNSTSETQGVEVKPCDMFTAYGGGGVTLNLQPIWQLLFWQNSGKGQRRIHSNITHRELSSGHTAKKVGKQVQVNQSEGPRWATGAPLKAKPSGATSDSAYYLHQQQEEIEEWSLVVLGIMGIGLDSGGLSS